MPDVSLLSLFSGIGAYEKALTNLNIPYSLKGFSEVDKFAVNSYTSRVSPKFMVSENVKSMQGKYEEELNKWIKILNNLGYNSIYFIRNAKEFGIPQQRSRFFMVSIRKDIKTFFNPANVSCEQKTPQLREFLLDNPREKYDSSEKGLKYMNRKTRDGRTHWDFGHHCNSDGIAKALTANMHKGVPYGVIRDLDRRLTPLECWRLQGFEDEDYHKAKQALEETHYYGYDKTDKQMYKQAGNSICVPILENILKELFSRGEE